MQTPFFKYQATGNDFVLMDNREGHLPSNKVQLAQRLCDRRFGIGSDGLIIIEESKDYDFEMIFLNPDGSQSLCGNGSRCAVKFAQKLGMIGGEAKMLTIDGPLNAWVQGEKVRIQLNDIDGVERIGDDLFLHNGSPHYLCFRDDLDQIDLLGEAHQIRYNQQFKGQGTNVNFIRVISDHRIRNRTYERGVEAETLSCGTGVVAASIGSSFRGVHSPVTIETAGGELMVEFQANANESFTDVVLTGPAEYVFEGTFGL